MSLSPSIPSSPNAPAADAPSNHADVSSNPADVDAPPIMLKILGIVLTLQFTLMAGWEMKYV